VIKTNLFYCRAKNKHVTVLAALGLVGIGENCDQGLENAVKATPPSRQITYEV